MEIQIKNGNTGEIETFTANEKGEIKIPNGIYRITDTLEIPAGVKIVGFSDSEIPVDVNILGSSG